MAPVFDNFCTELLNKVFSFLPTADLFTMYDVSKRFRAIMNMDERVNHLFIKKEGFNLEKYFKDSRIYITNLSEDSSIEFYKQDGDNIVQIEGLAMALRYLRIFKRKKIVHLNINFFNASREGCIHLFNYIGFFLPNLNELNISDLSHNVLRISYCNKITKLFITSCVIPASLGHLSFRFKYLIGLYLQGSNIFENINNIMCEYVRLEAIGVENLGDAYFCKLKSLNPDASIVKFDGNNLLF